MSPLLTFSSFLPKPQWNNNNNLHDKCNDRSLKEDMDILYDKSYRGLLIDPDAALLQAYADIRAPWES